ncbi:MAG: hypothetical protein ACKVRN_04875 [Pyrinomonadaceae bacterium]
MSAMVGKHSPLDWYYDILKKSQSELGEIKETSLRIFRLMPRLNRLKLWDTLKIVQINISDPLPYQLQTDEILKAVSNKAMSIERIRAKAIANDLVAKNLLEKINNHTAEQILFDAPSRRLESLMYYFDNPMASLPNPPKGLVPPPPNYKIDLKHLQSKTPGAIVRTATEWTAKSASAFSEAIDIPYQENIEADIIR